MYLDREQQELCFCIYRRGKGSKHLQFTNTSSSRPALLCFNTTGDLTLIPVLLWLNTTGDTTFIPGMLAYG
jgi:hypothetical protein